MKLYAKKITALKYLDENSILCNQNIKQYFITKNYTSFLNIIQNSKLPKFYEFIPEQSNVCLFFDIEIYKDKNQNIYDNCKPFIDFIKQTLNSIFPDFILQYIILESHLINVKKSFHIIIRIKKNNIYYYFKNVKCLKNFINTVQFKEYILMKIIDISVYREGIFRTIFSTKDSEQRFLVQSDLSDPFDPIESFVCYKNNEYDFKLLNENHLQEIEKNEEEVIEIELEQKDLTIKDKKTIEKFIKKHYNYDNRTIREILIDHQFNCIIVSLNDHFCHNIDREHRSNNQYIVIDSISSKRKCHDLDCKDYRFNEIKTNQFPLDLTTVIKSVLKFDKQEFELIENTVVECKNYITENFDNDLQEILFDKNEMLFRGNAQNSLIRLNGKCSNCNLEHQISNTGYCIKCIVCQSIYPKNQLIPIDSKYSNLNSFWNSYSQLINNGTVNINISNYYSSEEEFSCDVQLHDSIFKNKELTKLYNQVLDGHKVTKLAEVIYYINKDFIYTKNQWFFFNGSIWKLDEDNLSMKKTILDSTSYFNKINNFYEHKQTNGNSMQLIKNIKSLINKLNKPGFKDDIIKEAKIFFNDPNFISKLNSKKHLLPFTNGVYDLLSNSFRKTNKDDYINLTVNYPYSEIENPEVYKFINEVIPNERVRDYVLKK